MNSLYSLIFSGAFDRGAGDPRDIRLTSAIPAEWNLKGSRKMFSTKPANSLIFSGLILLTTAVLSLSAQEISPDEGRVRHSNHAAQIRVVRCRALHVNASGAMIQALQPIPIGSRVRVPAFTDVFGPQLSAPVGSRVTLLLQLAPSRGADASNGRVPTIRRSCRRMGLLEEVSLANLYSAQRFFRSALMRR